MPAPELPKRTTFRRALYRTPDMTRALDSFAQIAVDDELTSL
ncbi:hypothetical protein [Rhodococcus sp. MALMAid1271]